MAVNRQRIRVSRDFSTDSLQAHGASRAPTHDQTSAHQHLETGDTAQETTTLPHGEHLTQRDIIQLHRTSGNQSVMRALAQSKGRPIQRLPKSLDKAMGTVFDFNPAQVGIHTDEAADHVARSASSDAVTIGADIYFRNGAYQPNTAEGNAVIAREMAHVQRSRMTGAVNRSSAEVSGADRADSQEVGELFRTMGNSPAEVLRPAAGPHGKPSRAQRNVLQRDPTKTKNKESTGMRNFGIVTSKVLQGIFTTVLGPVGLLWRGPLIQKKVGEIWGDKTNIGYRTGKKDDNARYGNTKLGTFMRWLASISELLKEFTIWLGFASFIAAIVAAATHGILTPVFIGLGIATSVVAGIHFVLRALLTGLNGIRLYRITKTAEGEGEKAEKAKKKLPFIKHQMINDGMEGIGAAISSLLSGMGSGGLGSLGGDLAKNLGLDPKTVPIGRLAQFGLTQLTNLPQGVSLTSMNEGGKESVKPSSERFTGKGGKWANFKTGFLKDATDIKTDWDNRWTKSSPQNGGQNPPVQVPNVNNQNDDDQDGNGQNLVPQIPELLPNQLPPGNDNAPNNPVELQENQLTDEDLNQNQPPPQNDPNREEVLKMSSDIVNKGQENSGEQQQALNESQKQKNVIDSTGGDVQKVSQSTDTISDQLKDTKEKVSNVDVKKVDESIGDDEGKLDQSANEIEKAQNVKMPSTEVDDEKIDQEILRLQQAEKEKQQEQEKTGTPNEVRNSRDVQRDPNKKSVGSRLKSWFIKKLTSVKSAIAKLNAKILKGVIKFAGKFNKKNEGREMAGPAMQEETEFLNKDYQAETVNTELFDQFEEKAVTFNDTLKQAGGGGK